MLCSTALPTFHAYLSAVCFLASCWAVLPDTQQAQQAAATVQNLEERAKAHADITTQVGSAGEWRECAANICCLLHPYTIPVLLRAPRER